MALTTLAQINATLEKQAEVQAQTLEETKGVRSNIAYLIETAKAQKLDNLEKERESSQKKDRAGAKAGAVTSKKSDGGLGGIFSGITSAVGGAVASISSMLGLTALTPLFTSLMSFARLFLRGGAIGFVLYLIYDNWESIQGIFTNIYKALEPIIKWMKNTTVYKYLEENWEQIVSDFFGLFKKLFKGLERLTAGDFKGALENLDGLAFGLAGLIAFTKTGRGLVMSALGSVKDLVTGGVGGKPKGGKGKIGPVKIGDLATSTLGTMANPMYVRVVGGGPLGGPGADLPDGKDGKTKGGKKGGRFGTILNKAKELGKVVVDKAKVVGTVAVGGAKTAAGYAATATGAATLGLGATASAIGYATYKGKVQAEEWAKLKAQIEKNGIPSLSEEDLKKFIAAQEDFANAEDEPEGMIRTPDGNPVDRFLTQQAKSLLERRNRPQPKTRGLLPGGMKKRTGEAIPAQPTISKPVPQTAAAVSALNRESRATPNKPVIIMQDGSSKVVNNVNTSNQGLVLPSPPVFDHHDPYYATRGYGVQL